MLKFSAEDIAAKRSHLFGTLEHVQMIYFLGLDLLSDRTYLAGGALRWYFSDGKSEKISDYDLFFKDQLAAGALKIKLEDDASFEKIFECPEGKLTTFLGCYPDGSKFKVQLITENFYPTIEVLLDEFDIKACRFAYVDGFIHTYLSSIRDVKKKRVTIHRCTFPVATLKRIIKYSNKKYEVTNEAVLQVVNYIYNRGVNNQELNTRVYID